MRAHKLAIFLLASSACAGDDVPSWLREFSTTKTAGFAPNVPAVVLLDEERVTVDDNGRTSTASRKAIKILTKEGRKEAFASKVYVASSGKVKDFRAWMITPSGDSRKYGKEKIVDLSLAKNDVYNEVRARAVFASDDADVGSVFGYETVAEDRSVFTQFEWAFQNRLPALLSRYVLTLPGGWRAESLTYNHDKVAPEVAGPTYTWELKNLPFIEEEPASPPVGSLIPRLAISYFPAAGAKSGLGRAIANWAEVSRWMSELSDSQAVATEAISDKVRELTTEKKTELDRIRAIGRYVQSVKYVSIQTGLGRGGGYRPHSAGEVFDKQYGDCKDKANLMRTMLKAAGIQAYMVNIYSGDRNYVREDWASPQQFNHAIVAVKVSDATQAPIIVNHQALGRLLFFDPTDENTLVGDLPEHEQGSLALVVAGDSGALMRMPANPPSANRIERKTNVTLGPDGSIQASVVETSYGQAGAAARERFRRLARPEFEKSIERWVARGATGAKLSKANPADGLDDGQFSLDLEFSSEHYGQTMQNRLLVFKPAVLSRDSMYLTEPKRRYPIVLNAQSFQEAVRVKLPPGFKIDEMPDAAMLRTPFGDFTESCQAKNGELLFTRTLEIRTATLPSGQYAAVRSFFEHVEAAEQAPVVLVRE